MANLGEQLKVIDKPPGLVIIASEGIYTGTSSDVRGRCGRRID